MFAFFRPPAFTFIWLCVCFVQCLYAQTDSLDFEEAYPYEKLPLPLGMDFEIGMPIPTKKEISNLYPIGVHFELGPKVGMLPSQRLWVKPLGGVRWLPQNMESLNGAEMQHLLTWYTGAELTYQFQKGNLFMYPLLRLSYNWSRNFSSYTENDGTEYGNTTYSYTYIRGKGWSPEVGLRLQVRTGYLRLSYSLYRPNMRLSDRVIDDDHMAGYRGIEQQRLNFNTINIGIGYDLFIQ